MYILLITVCHSILVAADTVALSVHATKKPYSIVLQDNYINACVIFSCYYALLHLTFNVRNLLTYQNYHENVTVTSAHVSKLC